MSTKEKGKEVSSSTASSGSSSNSMKIVDLSNTDFGKEKISFKPEEVKKQFQKKAIAYVTGGIDSAYLLLWLESQPYNMDVRAVVLDVKGKNKEQIEAVEYICKKTNSTPVVIKVDSDSVDDVYYPEFYANYLIEYACQEKIKDIFVNVNNEESNSELLSHTNYNNFNIINMQARQMDKVIKAGLSDISFETPLIQQSKDAIILKVVESKKIDLRRLYRSEPKDEALRKEIKYLRKLGFVIARIKDPLEQPKTS